MTGYQSKRAMAQDKLAQPEQEPVAWIEHHKGGDNLEWDYPGAKSSPLYTTPPQRKPLTDEEIADYLGDEYHDMSESELRFFRLGEAATKEKNNGT